MLPNKARFKIAGILNEILLAVLNDPYTEMAMYYAMMMPHPILARRRMEDDDKDKKPLKDG